MRRYIAHIILFLSTVASPVLSQEQPVPPGVERDLSLYHTWQEAEGRDSAYFRAYRKFISDKPEHQSRYDAGMSDSGRGADRPAVKVGETMWALDTLREAFSAAFWDEKNYDKAFYIGFQLEEKLPLVTDSEYPGKRKIYYELGEAYYLFLDFHKSIELLEKALSPAPLSFDDTANLDALKIIGICYANIGEMSVSDEYFRATLLSGDIVLHRPLYNAYAISHLGCNEMLKGNYDNALALSSAVWATLRKTGDYGHLAGMCYCRGRSHLQKGDYKQASQWIDSLVRFARQDEYNYTKRIKQAYSLQAEYFNALGDMRLTKAYGDSLIRIYHSGEMEYISGYVARAAQRYSEERIEAQDATIKSDRSRITVLSLIALCCIAVIVVITTAYRRRNAAYKALAQRANEWAHYGEDNHKARTPHDAAGEDECSPLTEEEKKMMSLVGREMTDNYAYREIGLTLESLAERLGVHRNVLSKVVNKSTGANFNQYINSHRIKEAVRILSGDNREKIYFEELSERVGFNTQSSFYRAFKQFTGLSPTEYRNNKGGNLCD